MHRTLILVCIMCIGLVGLASPADVEVGKTGAPYTTVQEGIVAAGMGGTVTIIDSATYVEDVTIVYPDHAGVTIQAAAGERPTIQADNAINRFAAIGIVSPSDHFGVVVQAPCTFIGVNIENPEAQCNQHATEGALAASAMIVLSPQVTLQDCHIIGTSTSPSAGDWVTLLIVALSATPADVTLQNCEIYGGDYGATPSTFQRAQPGLPDSSATLIDCYIHDTLGYGFEADAGESTLIRCRIENNPAAGVEIGGGTATLISCDIVNNGGHGLALEWDSGFNEGRTNWPDVFTSDCLIANNGGRGLDVDDGTLDINYSIISRSGSEGVLMRNADPADAVLNMNFCDILAPGQTCVRFEGAGDNTADATITNSILTGDNGVLCDPAHTATVTYSDVHVTGTRFQNCTESNNVDIELFYVDRFGSFRHHFKYYNVNLNVGEGGADIGSQGPYQAPDPLRVRTWTLYN